MKIQGHNSFNNRQTPGKHFNGTCDKLRSVILALLVCVVLVSTGCEDKPRLNREIDHDAKPISEARFWETIDSIDPMSFEDQTQRRDALMVALKDWSDEDLKGFKLQYVEQFNRLYRHDIFAVFNAIMKLEEPEGFFAYRDELISRGSQRFNAVIEDPEAILEELHGTILPVEDLSFYMVGDKIKEKRSGIKGDALFLDLKFEEELQGEPISFRDEAEMRKRFPKLFEFIERRIHIENKQMFGK